MVKVGTAEFDVELSRAKVAREVAAVGNDIERGLGASAKKVESDFARTARTAVAGFLAYKGGQVVNDTIQAASNLSEQQNKVNVVFGESAGVVNKFAENSATALGQSKRQALEAAGTFGNLFRAIGLTEQQSAKMSTSLVGLAADLASFNNTDPADALDALRSGLVGEVEPLRRYGVSLSQVRVQAKAMELGLFDGKGQIDASAKAQASYAIILQDTALAQGDFARTSTGLANSQRITKAELENTKAEIGQGLIPVEKVLLNVTNDVLKVFGQLPPVLQTGIVGVTGLVTIVGVFGPKMKAGAQSLGLFKSSAEGAAGAAGGLSKAVGLLGVAAIGIEALDKATAGAKETFDASDVLKKTNAELDEQIRLLALREKVPLLGTRFEDINDLASLKRFKARADELGESFPALDAQIEKVTAGDARGAANQAKYGDAVADTTGEIGSQTGALAGLSVEQQKANDAAQAAVDHRKEVFSAARDEEGASRDLVLAVAAEAEAKRAAAGDSDEYRAAIKEITDARKGEVAAAKEVERAEAGVTVARESARRALRDERLETERSAISAERAKFALEDARDALGRIQDDPRSTARQKAQAALDVRDAELSLQEAQNRRGDSAADLAKAEKAGIEGSDAVVSAKERVTSALDSQREAEKRTADATKAAAKVLDDAKGKVAAATDKVKEAVFREADAHSKLVTLLFGAEAGNDAYNDSLGRSALLLDPRSPLRQNLTSYLADLQKLNEAFGVNADGSKTGTPAGEVFLPAVPYDPSNDPFPENRPPHGTGGGTGTLGTGGGFTNLHGKTVHLTVNTTNGPSAQRIADELTFGGH
jgi:hypothetical protein